MAALDRTLQTSNPICLSLIAELAPARVRKVKLCESGFSITISASTGPRRRRFFPVFTGNGSAAMWTSFTADFCIGPAPCSTKNNSTAMRTRSSTSSTPVRPGSPGGSTTMRAHFSPPPTRPTLSRSKVTASFTIRPSNPAPAFWRRWPSSASASIPARWRS